MVFTWLTDRYIGAKEKAKKAESACDVEISDLLKSMILIREKQVWPSNGEKNRWVFWSEVVEQ